MDILAIHPVDDANKSITGCPNQEIRSKLKGLINGRSIQLKNYGFDSSLIKTDQLAPCFTKSEKMNPLGAHLITQYYLGKSTNKELSSFNLNHPKDIEVLMRYIDRSKPFVLTIVCGGRHRTPVLVYKDNVVIMESLGTSKSKVGKNSVAQIVGAFHHVKGDFNFFVPSENRQSDSISCDTDAAIVANKFLKDPENFINHISGQDMLELQIHHDMIINEPEKNDDYFRSCQDRVVMQFRASPPEVEKFTQAISKLTTSPEKFSKTPISKKRQPYEGEQESVFNYALRNSGIASFLIEDTDEERRKKEEVVKELSSIFNADLNVNDEWSIKQSHRNKALDFRRAKLMRVASEMAKIANSQELLHTVIESSGLVLVLDHYKENEICDVDVQRELILFLQQQMTIDRSLNINEAADKYQVSLHDIEILLNAARMNGETEE